MRVLLCIYELLGSVGGAERSLSDLASALSKRGHAVLILNHQDVNKSGTALFYPLDKGVGLHSFTNESQRPDRPKDSSVESEGFIRYIRRRVFQCPLGHAGPWPPDVLQTKQVWLRDNELEVSAWRNQVKTLEPDVVVSFMVKTYVYVSRAISGLHVPHIISNRTDPTKSPVYYGDPMFSSLISDAVETSAFNVILHESYRVYFNERSHRKTMVIPNPINTVHRLKPHRREDGTRIVLNVGRSIHSKNQQLLIKSFSIISREFPEWKVRIYGADAGNREDLIRLANDLDLRGQVEFFDPVVDIDDVYRNADIFAFPSLYEGFPRALGEAASHGLPCLVVEDCVVTSGMVLAGQFGLVSRNTSEDYATKLKQLIADEDIRQRQGANALEFATRYRPDRVYDQWENLIRMTHRQSVSFVS
jgi:glycosyltransferase involved in cell wall biosynthesis